jgi:hypothetical protein
VGKTPSFGGFNLTSFAPKNLLESGSVVYDSPEHKSDEKNLKNLFGQKNYQKFVSNLRDT